MVFIHWDDLGIRDDHVGRRIGRSRLTTLWVAAGVTMSVTAQVGLAAQLSDHPVALMIAGAIAVSAWVLPGISGSLILLLLGLYPTVIVALSTLDARVLAPLGLGCVVGLLAFANGLKRVYARFRLETVCFLSGVLLGSLVRLWPWQSVQSYQFRESESRFLLCSGPFPLGSMKVLLGRRHTSVRSRIGFNRRVSCLGFASMVCGR